MSDLCDRLADLFDETTREVRMAMYDANDDFDESEWVKNWRKREVAIMEDVVSYLNGFDMGDFFSRVVYIPELAKRGWGLKVCRHEGHIVEIERCKVFSVGE